MQRGEKLEPASVQRRPPTLAELSEVATTGANAAALQVDSRIPIARYLMGCETLTRQAVGNWEHGNVDTAFIALVKACKLLIELLPTEHRGFTQLDADTRAKIRTKGQKSLDLLSKVKLQVVDRFEAWRRAHPNEDLGEWKQTVPARALENDKSEKKQMPMPSKSNSHDQNPRASSGQALSSGNNERSTGLRYIKPDRSSNGLDVRDILGYGTSQFSQTNKGTNGSTKGAPKSGLPYSTPNLAFTTNPLQPFSHSHSKAPKSTFQKYNGLEYPTLRPMSSIRMNNHQESQGFAPRSEQTFQYYQIATSTDHHPAASFPQPTSNDRPGPSFPQPQPARPPKSLPSPSFPKPDVGSLTSSMGQWNLGSPASRPSMVETQAQSLLSSNTLHATTEGGEALRALVIPERLISRFVQIADKNTARNIETCGLLMGTIQDESMLTVTDLLIPKQSATSDRCDTEDEGAIWSFMESKGLVTLGWIHTHPRQ